MLITHIMSEFISLMIQASPYPLLIAPCNHAGDLLDSVKMRLLPPVSSRNAIQCIRPDRLDHDTVWQTRDHTTFFIDIALMDADLIRAAGA